MTISLNFDSILLNYSRNKAEIFLNIFLTFTGINWQKQITLSFVNLQIMIQNLITFKSLTQLTKKEEISIFDKQKN